MRKKILRISQKLAKIGHFGTFQPGLPRPVGWREKKICQKVGQTCQQSSGVNKFHFYQKTLVSISHMLITEVSSIPFEKVQSPWHFEVFAHIIYACSNLFSCAITIGLIRCFSYISNCRWFSRIYLWNDNVGDIQFFNYCIFSNVGNNKD